MRLAASSTDCALRWRSSISAWRWVSKVSSNSSRLPRMSPRNCSCSPNWPSSSSSCTISRESCSSARSGVVAMSSALATACANSENCAPNCATASAEPRVLRFCSARARAWFNLAYRAEIASTTRVRWVASSTFRLAISSDRRSRSADIACMPASCSPSWVAVCAFCACSSSACNACCSGSRALSPARKLPVATPTRSLACCSSTPIASIAAVSM